MTDPRPVADDTMEVGMKPWVLMMAALFVTAAQAESPSTAGNGEATRAWLELQTSGHAASQVERPMSGPVAERAYKRYLDSFTHPIPERFERESFTEGGGGS